MILLSESADFNAPHWRFSWDRTGPYPLLAGLKNAADFCINLYRFGLKCCDQLLIFAQRAMETNSEFWRKDTCKFHHPCHMKMQPIVDFRSVDSKLQHITPLLKNCTKANILESHYSLIVCLYKPLKLWWIQRLTSQEILNLKWCAPVVIKTMRIYKQHF